MAKELKQRQAVRGGHKAYMTSITARTMAMITSTYCLQSHASVNCQVFNTVQARKEVLKHNGNCFVCLRKGHRYHDCHSGAKCRECKDHHHSSICIKIEERRESKPLDARSEPFIP